jgi:hypothetical protein
MIAHFPTLIMLAAGVILMLPRMPRFPANDSVFSVRVSPLTIALTSEASTWAVLMLGFGGFGFAAFSVGMKVGQIAEAAWWKGKLQKALTSTRETVQGGVRAAASVRASGERPGLMGSDDFVGVPSTTLAD